MAMWTGSLLDWFAVILAIVVLLKGLWLMFKPEGLVKAAKWMTDKKWLTWAYLAGFLYFSWFMLWRGGLNIVQYTVTFLAVASFYGYIFYSFPTTINALAKGIAKKRKDLWPMFVIMLAWGIWVLWYLFV